MSQTRSIEVVQQILAAQGIEATPTPEAVKVYQEAVDNIASHIHSDAAYAIEMNEQLDSYNTGW